MSVKITFAKPLGRIELLEAIQELLAISAVT